VNDDALDDHDDRDDFVAAGLYDPTAPDAPARLALLEYLVDEVGASIPEIVQAHEEGALLSFAAVRTLRPPEEHWTLSEIAARAEIEPELAAAIWRAAGFADVRPFERRFVTSDVVVFELIRDLATFVGREHSLQLVRTASEATARVAEAEIALLRSNVEAPLAAQGQYEVVARTYTSAARQLFPRVSNLIDTLHRHQLELIGNRYSAVNAPTSSANVVELAVGFADIAGYTGLSHRLDAPELATMLARFEATTGDVIAASGANVAKRIGDAVMFVTNAPGIACALALELIEACARERLPKLRVGLTVGEVIVRQGDFYGPTVNLAARLVASAEPGTALTDAELHSRLSSVRAGYGFAPAGRFQLAGFDEPLEVFQLIR
jgi:class 3 adenylate cyclase